MYLLVVQIKQQELDKLECLCTWVAMVSSFFRKAGMVPLLPALSGWCPCISYLCTKKNCN